MSEGPISDLISGLDPSSVGLAHKNNTLHLSAECKDDQLMFRLSKLPF